MIDYTNRNKNRQSTHKSRTSSAAQKAESSFGSFFIIVLIILVGAYFVTNDSSMDFISEKKKEIVNFINEDDKNQNEESDKKYDLIYFVNSSNSIRNIYWVHRNGSKKLYKTLEVGESYTQRVYPHHKWLISDKAGKELGKYHSKGEKSYITMYDSKIIHTNDEVINKEEKNTKKVSTEEGAKKLGIKNTLNKPKKSIEAIKPTQIHFMNNSNGIRKLYWLDYNGKMVLYKELKPKEKYSQGTFITHPWLVTDKSGNQLGVYYPEAKLKSIVLE